MSGLKFTIIKSQNQYKQYCDILEELIAESNNNVQDEIELLTLLIEKWDHDHNTFHELDPVELLKSLMIENELKAKDLVDILKLSKGTISKILNYHKGLSKDSIRLLSNHFKLSQEAFNRPYPLVSNTNRVSSKNFVRSKRKKGIESG